MNGSALQRLLASLGLVALIVAACAGGASSAAPGVVGGSDGEPGGSGSQPGSVVDPGSSGVVDPGTGGELTVPQPGQLDVHAVAAERLEAAVNGRSVTLRITWTSGVEPCHVLDTIVVDRGPMTFAITLREGRGPGDNVCIEIAKTKQAIVELGELEPGTYTISDAVGGAAPIEVVVG